MKVKELIERLECLEEDSEIIISVANATDDETVVSEEILFSEDQSGDEESAQICATLLTETKAEE